MASRGAVQSRPRSKLSAPWRTRISSPSTVRAPASRARRISARAAVAVDEVDDRRRSRPGSAGSAVGVVEPDRRAVDEQLGGLGRVDHRGRRGPRRALRVRARTLTSAPAALERPDRGAGAAAGAEHERGLRRASPSAARRPGASVLSAWIAPSSANVSVFAAPICARARRSPSSARASARLLVRDRHVGAREPGLRERARRSRRTARAGPAGAGSASRRGRAPSYAAWCIAGERLWSTGQPRTPKRFGVGHPSLLAGDLPPRALALAVVGLDVALELRVGRGEVVRAVAVGLDDVVEVVDASPGSRRP